MKSRIFADPKKEMRMKTEMDPAKTSRGAAFALFLVKKLSSLLEANQSVFLINPSTNRKAKLITNEINFSK